MRIRRDKLRQISSSRLIRILAEGSGAFGCTRCGARMFVRYASGLCPRCWNGLGPERPGEEDHLVEVALAVVGSRTDAALD